MLPDKKHEIVQSIITGENGQALAYLYNTTLKKVRKYIKSNSGSKEEADDIFQDAVIVFFEQVRMGKFNHEYDIDAYIYVIARNLWIDKVRKHKRINKSQLDYEMIEGIEYNDQLKILIDGEKTAALKLVFEKLDLKCQKILHYFIYEKLSMKEISIKMGYSSEDVAKTNHYRCKKYLSNLVMKDSALTQLLKG